MKKQMLVCMLLLLAALPGHMAAQSASLAGLIVDPSGAAVPDADVGVVSAATGTRRTTKTNETGGYTFAFLQPDKYGIEVSKPGFRKLVRSGVELTVGAVARVDLTLQIGTIDEVLTVSEDAPLVRTDSVAVGTTIGRRFVETMPLSGRSFNALIQLSPGVVLAKANTNDQWGQFSVNGQRQNANYFTIDGVSANFSSTISNGPYGSSSGQYPGFDATGGTMGLVSVDALQEFRIQTSSYAPEFGRMPGAQISMLTRSGTNSFHGTVYEYFRNEKLDATDWFVTANRLSKPALRQNNFGGVFGGPLWRDKTFFFVSHESLRARQPQTVTTEVPTAETRALTHPNLRPFVEVFPLPNGPVTTGGNARYVVAYSDPMTVDSSSLRVDHHFGSRLNAFGRLSRSPSQVARGYSALISTIKQSYNSWTATSGATFVFSPTVNSDLRFNWSRSNGINEYAMNRGVALPTSPLLTTHANDLFIFCMYSCYGQGFSANNVQRQVNLVDQVSAISGKHQLKFGADYRYLYPTNDGHDLYRTLSYNNDLDGLQSGIPRNGIFVRNGFSREVATHNLSLFAQDSWRVTPRLMLTYGVRWEFNPPPSARDDKPILALRSGRSREEMIPAPPGTAYYQTAYNNFGPRAGLAWQLGSGARTVLRAGFGLFHDLGSGGAAVGFLPWGPPYGASRYYYGVPFPSSDPRINNDPEPETPPYGSIWTADPELKTPYSLQWNVSLEREVAQGQAITLSYVAAAGRRLTTQDTLVRPNPYFANLYVTRSGGVSDYHSFQAQYQRRLSHGLQGIVNYTWSHSIDTRSIDTGFYFPSALATDVGSFKGPSDFDIRHSFSAAFSYDVPRVGSAGFLTAVLRDWSLDLLYRARTGAPVDILSYRDGGGGLSYFRPDRVPGQPVYIKDPAAPGGMRYNRAAFFDPTENRQGNLGRNALVGFGMWQADIAVRRQFRLTEGIALQLRGDSFNVFNHPNFGDPYNYTNSTLFGTSYQMFGRAIGSGGGGFNPLYQVGGPRSTQIALKLTF